MRNAAARSLRKGRRPEGRRHKAQRGALVHHPPRGEVRGTDGAAHLDPDAQAPRVVRWIWEACEPPGSRHGWWRALVAHEIRVPMRPHQGGNRGQLAWHRPQRMTGQNVLHHPISAGAARWGARQRAPRTPPPGRPNTGNTVHPPASCAGGSKDRLPASLRWQRCEALPPRWGTHRRRAQAPGAPRAGPAGCGGLLRCGRGGRRWAPSASGQATHRRDPCGRATSDAGAPGCLSGSGAVLDDGVVAQRRAVRQPASWAWRIAAAPA